MPFLKFDFNRFRYDFVNMFPQKDAENSSSKKYIFNMYLRIINKLTIFVEKAAYDK